MNEGRAQWLTSVRVERGGEVAGLSRGRSLRFRGLATEAATRRRSVSVRRLEITTGVVPTVVRHGSWKRLQRLEKPQPSPPAGPGCDLGRVPTASRDRYRRFVHAARGGGSSVVWAPSVSPTRTATPEASAGTGQQRLSADGCGLRHAASLDRRGEFVRPCNRARFLRAAKRRRLARPLLCGPGLAAPAFRQRAAARVVTI